MARLYSVLFLLNSEKNRTLSCNNYYLNILFSNILSVHETEQIKIRTNTYRGRSIRNVSILLIIKA